MPKRRLVSDRSTVRRSRWRWPSVATVLLGLVVAVCGIAPAPPGAAATERGCQTGKTVESLSAKVQAVEAPEVLPSYGQEVLRPTAIGHLLPSADAQVPTAFPSEDVSPRAPPVSL